MNSILVLFLSVSLVITFSIILQVEGKSYGKMWDLRYIKECKEKLNLTDHHFTVADLESMVPTTLKEGCMLDCYYYKIGKIEKKNQTSFIEHIFIGQPLKSGIDLTGKSEAFVKKVAKAEADCVDYFKGIHFDECQLVALHRNCVSKVMDGTVELPPKIIEDCDYCT